MRSNDAGRWALGVLVFVAAANGAAWLLYAMRSEDPSRNGPEAGGQVATIVPDVVGQDYESAKRALEAAGFDVPPATDPRRGRVKAQTPAARSRSAAGKTVTLQFEKLVVPGEFVAVPNVLTLNYEDASSRLKAVGLQAFAENDPKVGSKVERQTPEHGTKVEVNTIVKLRLSTLTRERLTGDVLVLLLQTDEAVKPTQAKLLEHELGLLKEKLGGRLIGGKVYLVQDAENKRFPSKQIAETFTAGFRAMEGFAKDPKVVNQDFKTVFVWLTNTNFSFEAIRAARANLEEQKKGRMVYIAYWHAEESPDLRVFLDRTCWVDDIEGLTGKMCPIFSLEPQRTP